MCGWDGFDSQTVELLNQPTSTCSWPDTELLLSQVFLQSEIFFHKKKQVKWFLQYQMDKPISGCPNTSSVIFGADQFIYNI